MENVIENNLDFNEMLNIIFHGLTEKVTLGLGIPSIILGFAGGHWISFLTPIVLVIGGSIKYWFDVKLKRKQIENEELEKENYRLEIKGRLLELEKKRLEILELKNKEDAGD